jgi:L-malate glycosyltransferase
MDRSYFPITKFGIRKSDGVTAVSKYLQTLTQNQVGRNDIEVIPNFVDTELFKKPANTDCSKHLIAPGGEPVLMHASNFRPIKRIINIIEIFERVLKKIEARLVFVGDGPERSVAERYCHENKLTEKVLFLGRQDNLPDLLGCADVFLLPSELESFGLAALEAMSCEVPVVATIVGGLPEVIVHGETGFLANLGDVDKMAEYSLEIIRNSNLRQRLGENGRRRAIEVFGQRKIVPLYERYYEKVLSP